MVNKNTQKMEAETEYSCVCYDDDRQRPPGINFF